MAVLVPVRWKVGSANSRSLSSFCDSAVMCMLFLSVHCFAVIIAIHTYNSLPHNLIVSFQVLTLSFRRHQVCWLRLKVTARCTGWPSEQRRLTAQYPSNQATRWRAQTHELKQIRRFLDYHDLDRADEPAFSLCKESGEDPSARYTSVLAFLMSFLMQRLGVSRSLPPTLQI